MLSDQDVAARVPPEVAVAAVRDVCRDLARGELEVPPRTVLASGSQLVMPAWHRPTQTGVLKVVTVGAAASGGPRVSGLVLWTGPDGSTAPLAGAGELTALRTAAMSAVAADVLAAKDASRLVVLGTGPQARAHVRAMAVVRPLTSVLLVGRDATRADAAREVLREQLPALHVDVCADVAVAVHAADLVCCTTTAATPLFGLDDLPEEVHVTAVGSHQAGVRELPRELLAAASLVAVDDLDASLAEAGEVIDALEHAVIRAEDLVPLPRLVQEAVTRPGGRTVFKSVGTAAFDWAVAAVLAGVRQPVTTPAQP